ncbi:MAG: 3-oxoacyl-(acyl carrier protein) synthase III [candidate division WS6 bacterium OLB20]|uniref:3-oxoacyl-(Acyl carrier protein) synthase III n=1 Tax=candidate division WS6 bacterium OLB20 TaxID=1617426 RepID=A0A136M0F9_9BACT|nr:MAG: 3-oxoacyl-(acyl carrier protein) synthase III [candidate division WS6 bacterium OLB20]
MEKLADNNSQVKIEIGPDVTLAYERGTIPATVPIGFATGFVGREIQNDGKGFQRLYQNPSAEYATMAQSAIVNGALAATGWKPEDVEAVVVGNGTPTESNLPETIAYMHGMNRADTFRLSMLACNSAAEVLFRTLSDPELHGKRTLYLGFDDISRYVLDHGQCDPLSPATFSSGGAALGIIPGVNLRKIEIRSDMAGTHELDGAILSGLHEFEDSAGVLAAVPPYDSELLGPDLVQDKAHVRMVRLPVPPDGKKLWMNGMGTSRFFLNQLKIMLPRVYELYSARYGQSEHPMMIAGHHPSPQLGHLIRKQLNPEQLQFPWVVEEGNVSGGTSAIALARVLARGIVRHKEHFMVAGYGAGGTATAFIAATA